MAVMDAVNRLRTRIHIARHHSPDLANVNKADLQAAVDAADSWVDSNAASFNSALPQPFRGAVGATGKALLLAYICLRRAGKLTVDEDGGA